MPRTDTRQPSATQSPPPAGVREGGRDGALAEARRTMEICNACRYCEGFCPVFPAMELRRAFSNGDLGYLANLCHNCKGCWHACQYAPPHAETLVDIVAPLAAAAEVAGLPGIAQRRAQRGPADRTAAGGAPERARAQRHRQHRPAEGQAAQARHHAPRDHRVEGAGAAVAGA